MKIQSQNNMINFSGYDARKIKAFVMTNNYANIANEVEKIGKIENFKVLMLEKQPYELILKKDGFTPSKTMLEAWAQDIWGIVNGTLLARDNLDDRTNIWRKLFSLVPNKTQLKKQEESGLHALSQFVDLLYNAPAVNKNGKKLFTTSILDCIAGVIIDSTNRARMFRLCTRNQQQAKKTRQKGFDIRDIERRIMEKINLNDENIHAIILGGIQYKENSKYNANKVCGIRRIFEKNRIPYTEITCRRNTHVFGHYSLLYDNKSDTLYISESRISDKGYGRIKLEDDFVVYDTYAESIPYESTKRRTGVKEFFESQFRNVRLCKFDEFV